MNMYIGLISMLDMTDYCFVVCLHNVVDATYDHREVLGLSNIGLPMPCVDDSMLENIMKRSTMN